MVLSLVDKESEWDTEQREIAVALEVYEASLNVHGVPLAEAMSPLADPDNPERRWQYVVDPPARDWVAEAMDRAVSAKRQEFKELGLEMPESYRWGVRRVDL